MIDRIKENLALIPAFRLLIWYFLGSSLAIIFVFPVSLVLFSISILILIILIYLTWKDFSKYELVIFIFALWHTFYVILIPHNHYSKKITSTNQHRDIKVCFQEDFYGQDSNFSMPVATLEVLAIKDKDIWHNTVGKTLFVAKNNFLKKSYYKGSILEGSGTFYQLDADNNYERSLIYQGYTHKFFLTEIIQESHEQASFLASLREKVIENTTLNLAPENQGLLVAMYLGFKNALTYQDKLNYKRSGIMHIFAVSGLHIGIIFTILMFFGKIFFLPVRRRYLFIPIILFLYVILVGCSASAMRAWLMLSIWSWARLFWRPVLGLNTLTLAALIIVLIEPTAYLQGGFQYSFLIVSLLILAYRYLHPFFLSLNEKELWQLHYRSKFLRLLFINFLKFISIMLVAWLASIPLNLYFNYNFIPASFFVNLILGFIVWLCLFFALLKTFLASFFVTPLNDLLELAAQLGSGISEESSFNISWGEISVLAFFLYYLFFILALWLPIRWYFRLTLISCSFSLILFARFDYQPQIYCFIPKGEIVPNILYLTAQRQAVMINASSYIAVKDVQKKLKKVGVDRIDLLIFPHHLATYQRGLRYMNLPQRILSSPFKYARSSIRKFYKHHEDWQQNWNFIPFFNHKVEIISGRHQTTVFFKNRRQKLIIKYRIDPLKSIEMSYEFWHQDILLKQQNLSSRINFQDEVFIVNLPQNFLKLWLL